MNVNGIDYSKIFLPYQKRWYADKSRIKVWEKSRRIGATFFQALEDVIDCIEKAVPSVWFSSADDSAAKEYIEYCSMWAKMLRTMAETSFNEVEIVDDKEIYTHVIRFKNNTKITAMSSNPKAFRSKGGKVVLDEFAWHDDPQKLWDAASPAIFWGFPLRILSTHNGKNSLFYQFIEKIKKEKLDWSLHTTPIQLAVEEGVADKIMGRVLTKSEKEQFLKDVRKTCRDEDQWQQEYCCIAVDESVAFLPYNLIDTVEHENILTPLNKITGDLYVGMDIARRKDLSVIWALEKLGLVYYTRIVIVMEKTPFRKQKEALFPILEHNSFRRACIDETGIGMQLAEEAQYKFGKYRVEPIWFTNKVKESLAYPVRTQFQDRTTFIPKQTDIREDLHSMRKITTITKNIRFDSASNMTDGHGDRFWALALALHAGDNIVKEPVVAQSRKVQRTNRLTRGYQNMSFVNLRH